jgi:hypothetical protein
MDGVLSKFAFAICLHFADYLVYCIYVSQEAEESASQNVRA